MAITVGNAIKNRATNEEILAILKELPNPNQDDDDGQSSSTPQTKDRHHQREVGEIWDVRRHAHPLWSLLLQTRARLLTP